MLEDGAPGDLVQHILAQRRTQRMGRREDMGSPGCPGVPANQEPKAEANMGNPARPSLKKGGVVVSTSKPALRR